MNGEKIGVINLSKEKRSLLSVFIFLLLVLIVRAKITDDFQSGELQSLFVRIGLILGFSLLIYKRLPNSIKIEKKLLLRQGGLLFVCGLLLFYPLFSHLSILSSGVFRVKNTLEKKQSDSGITAVEIIKAFPKEYEKFLAKQNILSKAYVYLDGIVKIYLLKVSPSSKVALGKNGFFYEGYGARKVEKGIIERFDNIADYMGQIPFTETELRQWKRTLEERSYWLEKQKVKFVFVLAPTKGFIYPEYLPGMINKRRGQTRYEQLSSYLKKNSSVHFIDLLPGLIDAKKKRDYPLLFYKTDFHWNYYGSLIAYQDIIRGINDFFPQYNIVPYGFDDFKLDVNKNWAHHRFMELISLPPFLHKNDHYLTMRPLGKTNYDTVAGFPSEGVHDVRIPSKKLYTGDGQSMKISLLENDRQGLPLSSIVLLGDSFLEKCVYYFSGHANRVYNYRTIVNFPYKIFSFVKPDIVVQEVLNMFLLRPPPLNPPIIQQAWLEKMFVSNARNTKSLLAINSITHKNNQEIDVTWHSDSSALSVNKKPSLYKLEIMIPDAMTLLLRIKSQTGEKLFHARQWELSPGINTLFFEEKSQNFEKITISTENGSLEKFEIKDITRTYVNEG